MVINTNTHTHKYKNTHTKHAHRCTHTQTQTPTDTHWTRSCGRHQGKPSDTRLLSKPGTLTQQYELSCNSHFTCMYLIRIIHQTVVYCHHTRISLCMAGRHPIHGAQNPNNTKVCAPYMGQQCDARGGSNDTDRYRTLPHSHGIP